MPKRRKCTVAGKKTTLVRILGLIAEPNFELPGQFIVLFCIAMVLSVLVLDRECMAAIEEVRRSAIELERIVE